MECVFQRFIKDEHNLPEIGTNLLFLCNPQYPWENILCQSFFFSIHNSHRKFSLHSLQHFPLALRSSYCEKFSAFLLPFAFAKRRFHEKKISVCSLNILFAICSYHMKNLLLSAYHFSLQSAVPTGKILSVPQVKISICRLSYDKGRIVLPIFSSALQQNNPTLSTLFEYCTGLSLIKAFKLFLRVRRDMLAREVYQKVR